MSLHTRASLVRAKEAFVDAAFDAGWKQFVDAGRQANRTKNARMMRGLERVCGAEFVKQLVAYMKAINAPDALIRLTHQPLGTRVTERRFPELRAVWVEMKTGGEDGDVATMSIEVKTDRWIQFSTRL